MARRRDGDKPFSEGMMYRVASFVVADYWWKRMRKPTILSLDHQIEDGDGMEDAYEALNGFPIGVE